MKTELSTRTALSVGWQHMHASSSLPGPFCAQRAASSTETLDLPAEPYTEQAGAGWGRLGQAGLSWDRLGQAGALWIATGLVGTLILLRLCGFSLSKDLKCHIT